MNATEARKNFFSLLDSALEGEAVKIERKGVLLRLVPEYKKSKKAKKNVYKELIHDSTENADTWGWEWNSEKGLVPKKKS